MNTTAAQALRILRAVCITTGLMAIALATWLWDHRAEIRAGLIRFAAACIVATEAAYRAGQATRRAIHQLNQQPLPAAAPINATLEAAREALARLVARLYPEPVLR